MNWRRVLPRNRTQIRRIRRIFTDGIVVFSCLSLSAKIRQIRVLFSLSYNDAMNNPLRLLIIGAHPDDADFFAGGTAALYRAAGHVVKMVSVTNGDAGHQTLRGAELARRRRAEAVAAGAVIGATYDVLDNHDGELIPTLENRGQVIRLIRTFRPDLVLTHRPNDYHPDHRYTSTLVQDAAYMVTVPAIVPDVPHLPRDPVIAYLPDVFQKPYPFRPSVAVDIGRALEKK